MDWQRLMVYVGQGALYLLAYGVFFFLLGKLPTKWLDWGCFVALLIPIIVAILSLVVSHNWVYVFISLSAYLIVLFMLAVEVQNRNWGHGW